MRSVENHSYYAQISRVGYLAMAGASQSDLKEFAAGPEVHWRRKFGDLGPRERTPAMQFGCDVEEFLQTGTLADIRIIPGDVLSANGSRAGAKWKEFLASMPDGGRALKEHEARALYDSLERIRDQIAAHGDAAATLKYGEWQIAKQWTCPDTGLALKGLLDLRGSGFVCDVKTTATIEPAVWLRQAYNLRYHWQAAHYLETEDHATFVFLVVENQAPHRVELFELEPELIEIARKQLAIVKTQYAAALRDVGKVWRSPTHGSLYRIPAPRWMLSDDLIYGGLFDDV